MCDSSGTVDFPFLVYFLIGALVFTTLLAFLLSVLMYKMKKGNSLQSSGTASFVYLLTFTKLAFEIYNDFSLKQPDLQPGVSDQTTQIAEVSSLFLFFFFGKDFYCTICNCSLFACVL